MQEYSMYDPDTKDSGFGESPSFEELPIVGSLDEDLEATILDFPVEGLRTDLTPRKALSKRLNCIVKESPSIETANSIKRLKLDDCEENSFEKSLSNSAIKARHIVIKEAVEKSEEQQLIGDFSKSYALPLSNGFHPDLKSISADTLKDVLEGKYKNIVDSFKIIDSRYPYEFLGGHIKNALNIYTKEGCLKLLNEPIKAQNERHILIVHCEFSKERGPNLIRTLRKEDRAMNRLNYPALTYPEIYVLEGGYKKFFESYPEYCFPMKYKKMLDPNHAEELRTVKTSELSCCTLLRSGKRATAVKNFKNPVNVRKNIF
ncbi:hypothetical protein ABEB36_006584 [Hypothenemus hampei]|uniref:protein-tyrosine-phosphatase n=1 Tax=Hypothenemus hampei TaxID=57062 RepID=A0ABD1ER24_HYPHA